MKKLKEILSSIGLVVLSVMVVTGGMYMYDSIKKAQVGLGSGYVTVPQTLSGSLVVSPKLPKAYVFADSTTTDLTKEGGVITQLVPTAGIDTVILAFKGYGAYATNTFSVRLNGSFDGTTYYDIKYASSTDTSGTTTPSDLMVGSVRQFQVPISTTTNSYPFNVKGYNYVRFMFIGPSDTDNDGKEWVKMGIKAWSIESVVR